MCAAPRVEWSRRRLGPLGAAQKMRSKGTKIPARGTAERAWLQRAVHTVDRIFPGGPNCYRRALLEMALDSGAASEPLMMGFRIGGGPGSGHAWLASHPPAATYDAVISV